MPHPQDIRLLNAGKAPQKAAEIDRDLDKADAMIRVLFNDVQTLKDGRHPQGEQMYRRVYRLHERLVAIRTEYNLRLKSGAPVTTQAPPALGQRPRQELDDATLRYLQDLLAWVEENQRRLGAAEWGVDLPTVESHLGSHRGLHQSIEEFRAKIERARADEVSWQPAAIAASQRSPALVSSPGPSLWGAPVPWGRGVSLWWLLPCAHGSLSPRRSSHQVPATLTGSAWASWTCSTPSCW